MKKLNKKIGIMMIILIIFTISVFAIEGIIWHDGDDCIEKTLNDLIVLGKVVRSDQSVPASVDIAVYVNDQLQKNVFVEPRNGTWTLRLEKGTINAGDNLKITFIGIEGESGVYIAEVKMSPVIDAGVIILE